MLPIVLKVFFLFRPLWATPQCHDWPDIKAATPIASVPVGGCAWPTADCVVSHLFLGISSSINRVVGHKTSISTGYVTLIFSQDNGMDSYLVFSLFLPSVIMRSFIAVTPYCPDNCVRTHSAQTSWHLQAQCICWKRISHFPHNGGYPVTCAAHLVLLGKKKKILTENIAFQSRLTERRIDKRMKNNVLQ